MWLLGHANQKEIKSLKKQGWHIDKVDVVHFNKALNAKYDPKNDPELKTLLESDDIFVSVFVNKDMVKQLIEWSNNEKSQNECRRKAELMDLRKIQADDKFATADNKILDIPEDSEVVGTDGWEYDGDNRMLQKFYFSNPDGGDSLIGTFIVTFKKNSDTVEEVHSNIW